MLSAKKIPAGKSGQIEVKIATGGFSGAVQKLVTVTTNDPHQSVVTLSVKAVIEPEIGLSDSMIFFGNTPQGKEVRREVILTLRPGKAIRILSATSKDPNVTVKLEPVPGSDGKKLKLVAVQKGDAKPGYHFGQIVLKTNSSRVPEVVIYERGMVASPGN